MPDPSTLLAALLGLAAVGLLVWFALGTGANVQRGNALLAWLQRGLPLLGPRTTLRWLGSSVVELRLVDPPDPFREVTLLVVLEPRDVAWLWALGRARGRRDFVIVRADLRRAPRIELHAADPAGWTSDEVTRLLADPSEAWRPLDWSSSGVALAGWRGRGEPAAIRPRLERIARASGGLWRVSISQTVPHLQVHARPPDTRRVGADEFLRPIRDLAADLLAER
ncbi:MAG TPA: hypothetical protein VNJ28_08795 [Candidatus Limnocylindrales bacterium]|nr:hypothetical protein [Candidatus Limnocylindrales bacterium]